MRTTYFVSTCCLLVLLGCGQLVSPACAADREAHVVVVCIDGLASYLLDDAKAPLPTVRRLAGEGAVAESGMKVSNPSITWPNHSSLITGVRPEKHGVLANGVLVRGAPGLPTVVDAKREQRELLRVPTIFEAAKAAGLTTAEINWPCTRGSKSLDDSFPDVPDQVDHMSPRLRAELVAAGILQDATQPTFMNDSVVGRDVVWTDAACHVLKVRRPNLLFVHLLNCDATHHALGPQTPAGYTANAFADACLARIVRAIDDAGIRPNTTICVVADHGFTMTPLAILPNVKLRQEKLLTVTAGKISDARVHVVPEGGIGLIYCTEPGSVAADRDAAKKLFEGQEGVAEVVYPERFAEFGMPHPREYAQAPDAILVAKDGYAVSGSAEGDSFVASNKDAKTSLGSHGFVSSFGKMNAACVLSGRGIKPGAKLQAVENIDLAPTIAQLLKVDLPNADGKVLTGALSVTQ